MGYGNGMDTSRLIGMVIALAAEVFVMKAHHECLRRALLAHGEIDAEALDREAASEAMKAWFAAEEQGFTQAVLEPLIAGDHSRNVVAEMRQV